MQDAVVLQWWQFLLLSLFAAYGLWRILLLPLLQGYIYRRKRVTLRHLDEELNFGVPGYALADRSIWLDRLINDPGVCAAIDACVTESGESSEEVVARARDYANEIVPRFNVLVYFRLGYRLARLFLRIYYWIRVLHSEDHDYDHIPKDSLVVLVSNHRSNFDPLLLIYLASRRAPISYSAGEWALAFPFRQLLHAIGFYVLRRQGDRDVLYRRVLERYVFLAASQCVPQGLFLEGGLSRDGKMLPAQTGMINYLLKAYGEGQCRDIVFIPAALNYDKVPEDRTLVSHREQGFQEKGRFYSLLSFLRFVATVVTYVLPRRHKPFGYACVNFGRPVSISQWQQQRKLELGALNDEQRRQGIQELAADLSARIEGLIPVLPTNVLAHVLIESEDLPISELELKVRALKLIHKLAEQPVSLMLPNNDEDFALGQGIYILLRRNIIRPTGDSRFQLVESQRELLNYYRDTIAHVTTLSSSAEDGQG